jgi:hypothetical protein
MWTVWEFKSVDGRQRIRKIRRSELGEDRYQHEYQRIVYRGEDYQAAKRAATG